MKKIILMLSFCFIFLGVFSFIAPAQMEEKLEAKLFENEACSKEESVVNVTTVSRMVDSTGIIVGTYGNVLYIAASAEYYSTVYKYEVILHDDTSYKADLLGVANEDGVMLLKVVADKHYCSVTLSTSDSIETLTEINVVSKRQSGYSYSKTYAIIPGLMNNPKDDRFARYYVTLLNDNLGESYYGGAAFDASVNGNLLGIITGTNTDFRDKTTMLDVDKLVNITHDILREGKYTKRYIKYDLLDVNSLTNHEKYLYSLSEDLNSGVLISSVHYLNYFYGGLNQGMVIKEVEGKSIKNCYELDNVLANYRKGSKISLKVRTIRGKDRTIKIKL